MALSSNPQYHQKQANIYLFTHLEVSWCLTDIDKAQLNLTPDSNSELLNEFSSLLIPVGYLIHTFYRRR
jgi:hypothetical protein